MSVKITDGQNIFQDEVKEPYMVIETQGVLLKIGEKDAMNEYFETSYNSYISQGYPDMATSLVLVQLPLDQEEIDKIFTITGYAKRYLE